MTTTPELLPGKTYQGKVQISIDGNAGSHFGDVKFKVTKDGDHGVITWPPNNASNKRWPLFYFSDVTEIGAQPNPVVPVVSEPTPIEVDPDDRERQRYDATLDGLKREHALLVLREGHRHTNFCDADPCRTAWLIEFLTAHAPEKECERMTTPKPLPEYVLTDKKTGKVWCRICSDWHAPEQHSIDRGTLDNPDASEVVVNAPDDLERPEKEEVSA